MKLRYRILWFDDDPDWVEELSEEVVKIVQLEGFICENDADIIKISTKSEFNEDHGTYSDYNIILMDFDLGYYESGADIIKDIRDGNHYTDVLFYSNQETDEEKLRKLISERQIDGVYCSERDDHFFLEKFKQIFLSTIKKIQDPENLRGLVMAEVSDLDDKKKKILRRSIEKELVTPDFFIEEVITKTVDWSFNKLKDLKKYLNLYVKDLVQEKKEYSGSSFNSFIDEFIFGTHKKGEAVETVINKIGLTTPFSFESYCTEIITPRNELAHKSETIDDSGKIFYGSFEFNFENCKKMRENIKKYSAIFDQILTKIELK